MSRHKEAETDACAGPVTLAGKSVVRAKRYSFLEVERAGLTEEDARSLRRAATRSPR